MKLHKTIQKIGEKKEDFLFLLKNIQMLIKTILVPKLRFLTFPQSNLHNRTQICL